MKKFMRPFKNMDEPDRVAWRSFLIGVLSTTAIIAPTIMLIAYIIVFKVNIHEHDLSLLINLMQ